MLKIIGKLLIKALLVLLYIPFHFLLVLCFVIYVVGGTLFKVLGIIMGAGMFIFGIVNFFVPTGLETKDLVLILGFFAVSGYVLFFLPNVVALIFHPLGVLKEEIDWRITVW